MGEKQRMFGGTSYQEAGMRVPIVFILIAAVAPAVLAGQASYGIAGGVSLLVPSPQIRGSQGGGFGFSVTGYGAVQVSPVVAARIEASLSDLPLVTRFVGGPVPGNLGAGSLTANAVLGLTRAGIGPHFYVVAGAGPIFVAGNYVSSGWQLGGSAGLGCTFPVHGRSQPFAELRLEKWVGLSSLSNSWPWVVPLTVGLRL